MLDRYKAENKTLPLLISVKNGQVLYNYQHFLCFTACIKNAGIHIDNEKVSYKNIEALVEVLTMIKAEVQKILTVGEFECFLMLTLILT